MVTGPVPLPGGVDNAVDQVQRAHDFIQRHPYVSLTTPRQNGTREFRAAWTVPDGTPDADAIAESASHYMLRFLLDYLEARFDRGTSG